MKLIDLLQVPGDTSQIALHTSNRSISYGDLQREVAQMISQLHLFGMRAGQRVVAILDHDEVALATIAAASALGLQILMPYNLQDAAYAEWQTIINTAQPDHVLYLKKDQSAAAQLAATSISLCSLVSLQRLAQAMPAASRIEVPHPAEIANFLVLFTSGSTGKPKAISISERLICRRIASVAAQLGFAADARILMSGLMNNTTGVIFSFGALLHHATLVLPPDRHIAAWPALVAQQRITHMMLRPVAMQAFFAAQAATPQDLSSMRVMAYGAAALPARLLEQGRRLMPCAWVQGYGLSETYGPFCWLNEADHQAGIYQQHVYCVGKPDHTLQVCIRADASGNAADGAGEVLVKGDMLMQGYYDLATHAVQPVGEWFATGDYGYFTECGHLVLKGRISNTILSENGHRIYPEEVESLLHQIDGVEAAMLIALPGQQNLGNQPVACIYGPLCQQADSEIASAVQRALQGRLSAEKWPTLIYASRLPFAQSQNDKFVKSALLNQLQQQLQQQSQSQPAPPHARASLIPICAMEKSQ